MRMYKRENKIKVKKELTNFMQDEIDDQIEMQQMEDDIFGWDEMEDYYFEDF